MSNELDNQKEFHQDHDLPNIAHAIFSLLGGEKVARIAQQSRLAKAERNYDRMYKRFEANSRFENLSSSITDIISRLTDKDRRSHALFRINKRGEKNVRLSNGCVEYQLGEVTDQGDIGRMDLLLFFLNVIKNKLGLSDEQYLLALRNLNKLRFSQDQPIEFRIGEFVIVLGVLYSKKTYDSKKRRYFQKKSYEVGLRVDFTPQELEERIELQAQALARALEQITVEEIEQALDERDQYAINIEQNVHLSRLGLEDNMFQIGNVQMPKELLEKAAISLGGILIKQEAEQGLGKYALKVGDYQVVLTYHDSKQECYIWNQANIISEAAAYEIRKNEKEQHRNDTKVEFMQKISEYFRHKISKSNHGGVVKIGLEIDLGSSQEKISTDNILNILYDNLSSALSWETRETLKKYLELGGQKEELMNETLKHLGVVEAIQEVVSRIGTKQSVGQAAEWCVSGDFVFEIQGVLDKKSGAPKHRIVSFWKMNQR